jgi:hypothetical protein
MFLEIERWLLPLDNGMIYTSIQLCFNRPMNLWMDSAPPPRPKPTIVTSNLADRHELHVYLPLLQRLRIALEIVLHSRARLPGVDHMVRNVGSRA